MSSMPDKPEIYYKYCMCAIKLRSLKFQVTISQPYNKESIGKLFLVCVCVCVYCIYPDRHRDKEWFVDQST